MRVCKVSRAVFPSLLRKLEKLENQRKVHDLAEMQTELFTCRLMGENKANDEGQVQVTGCVRMTPGVLTPRAPLVCLRPVAHRFSDAALGGVFRFEST